MALVVGIFPGSDPQDLQQALAAASLDASKVRVITNAAPSAAHSDAPFDFVHVAQAQRSNSLSDEMTRGTGIMSDAGGTGVPGSGLDATVSSFSHSSAADYLAGVGIPDDEVDNYNDAITDGKTIVVYSDEGDAQPEAEAFKKAGLKHIRLYP